MKHSVYSKVVWICVALAAISVLAWAAPAMKTGVKNRQKVLVVRQSIKTRTPVVLRDLSKMKRVNLDYQDKITLFNEGGFQVINGIFTKARFTPSQPFIAKQGRIMAWHADIWRTDDPIDSLRLGYIEFPTGDGYIDLTFYPFELNKPVLVVFNINVGPKENAFELWAGDQIQKLTLGPGCQNVACIVMPTTKDWRDVTLLCKSGDWWAFNSVEVVVQK